MRRIFLVKSFIGCPQVFTTGASLSKYLISMKNVPTQVFKGPLRFVFLLGPSDLDPHFSLENWKWRRFLKDNVANALCVYKLLKYMCSSYERTEPSPACHFVFEFLFEIVLPLTRIY